MLTLSYTGKKKTNNTPLQAPHAVDASLAAEDEEVHHDQDDDPSVVPVDGGRASSPPRRASGGGSRGPSPTPPTPPPTGETLADTLAHMVDKGLSIPGLRDEDHLLQGNS